MSRGDPRDFGARVRHLADRWAGAVRAVRATRTGRLTAYAVALVLFGGALVVSLRKLPPVTLHAEWLWVLSLAVPASAVLNALEYRMSGRMVGQAVGFRSAFRVTVLASAANLLPLPGAAIVRTKALRLGGSPWSGALQASVSVGIAWGGVNLLLAGSVLAATGRALVGVVVVAGGLLAFAALVTLLPVSSGRSRWMGRLAVLEALFVGVGAVRLYAVIRGLGVDVSLPRAVVLALSNALAALAGLFPGGLGLREILAGAMATLVDIAPSVGTFSAVLDRTAGLLVLAVLAAAVLLSQGLAETGEEGR